MAKRAHESSDADAEECCVCMREYGTGRDDAVRDDHAHWRCAHRVCAGCAAKLDEKAYECPLCRAPRTDGRERATEQEPEEREDGVGDGGGTPGWVTYAVDVLTSMVGGQPLDARSDALVRRMLRVNPDRVAASVGDVPAGDRLIESYLELRQRVALALRANDAVELRDALDIAETLFDDIDAHLARTGRPRLFTPLEDWPRVRAHATDAARYRAAPPLRRDLARDVAALTDCVRALDRQGLLRVTTALLDDPAMQVVQRSPSTPPRVNGDLALLAVDVQRRNFRNPREVELHRTRLVDTLTALAPREDAYGAVHAALLACQGAGPRGPSATGPSSAPRSRGAGVLGGVAASVRLVPSGGDGSSSSLPLMVAAHSSAIVRAAQAVAARADDVAHARRRRRIL